MRLRIPLTSLLIATGVLLWPSADAHARGGRFSGPAAAPAPRSSSTPEADAGPTGHSPGCGGSPGTPLDQLGNEGLPSRDTGFTEGALPGRKRPSPRARAPGLDDWIYWYEVNREQFEDLRRDAYVTEANPLFGIGGAVGERAGRAERRLDDAHRKALTAAVRDVLAEKADTHWIFTEGAAYVALGKIATTDGEIELLLRALGKDERYLQYVRESAALGLGQLRRSEARRQLPATTLHRVRETLTRVLEDPTYAVRTRAFAALSLGLLGDQPALDKRQGKTSAETLFRVWWQKDLPDEVQVGALLGLSLHDPDDIPALCRVALQACVTRGKLKDRTWSPIVRSQAALTLGRIGGKVEASVLAAHVRSRSAYSPALTQAAVIAVGTVGRRVPGMRAELIDTLLEARTWIKDPAGRRLALMAVARMLALDVAAGAPPRTGPAKALYAAASDGAAGDRAFAALALGVAVRGIDESIEDAGWHEQRARALAALQAGFADRGLDGHARAGFATALGVARDASSAKALLESLVDADADPELRAHAALALGLLGQVRGDVLTGLRASLADARSDRLRMHTVTALGLLGGGSAKDRDRTIEILLAQLKQTRNQNVKGQIAITLARIGDARAVRPLIGVLDAMQEPHINRALACAALGLMGDEERTPVLSAARRDSYYLGGSAVVLEILDVL